MWVVSGLHCLPLWLYGQQWGLLSHWLHLPPWIQALGTLLLAAGRLLALSAEVGTTCHNHKHHVVLKYLLLIFHVTFIPCSSAGMVYMDTR